MCIRKQDGKYELSVVSGTQAYDYLKQGQTVILT